MTDDDNIDVTTIILEYVCPGFGVICANIMFSAPYRDLQNAVLKGEIGNLNPTPWAFMLGNCLGWITYGCLRRNYFVYFANAPRIFNKYMVEFRCRQVTISTTQIE